VPRPGLTLDDTAQFLGHATWLERKLFAAVGDWVRSTPEPAVKLAFARESRHHGWHAELLEPLRPDTRDHPLDGLGPFDASWRTMTSKMLAANTTAARLERLEGLLVRTVDCYEEHLGALRPVRDAPLERILRLLLDDERADLAEVKLLQSRRGTD
jgi:hypothetical protein